MKKRKFRVFIATLLIAALCFAGTPTKVYAGYWGEALMSTMFRNIWTMLLEIIRQVVVKALKQAAIEQITSAVDNMVSGGGGGSDSALFITDWEKFLENGPAENAEVYLNDMLTYTGGGRSSISDYASSSAEGIMSNYTSSLKNSTLSAINNEIKQVTIQEYVQGSGDLFGGGNWRGFDALTSNSSNNFFGNFLSNKALYEEKLESEKEAAKTKAVAYQGYKASESGGQVATPGSAIKDIQASANSIGNQALATAQGMAEVVAGMVVQVVTKSIKQGVGSAKRNIQKEITNTTGRFKGQLKQRTPDMLNKPSY